MGAGHSDHERSGGACCCKVAAATACLLTAAGIQQCRMACLARVGQRMTGNGAAGRSVRQMELGQNSRGKQAIPPPGWFTSPRMAGMPPVQGCALPPLPLSGGLPWRAQGRCQTCLAFGRHGVIGQLGGQAAMAAMVQFDWFPFAARSAPAALALPCPLSAAPLCSVSAAQQRNHKCSLTSLHASAGVGTPQLGRANVSGCCVLGQQSLLIKALVCAGHGMCLAVWWSRR